MATRETHILGEIEEMGHPRIIENPATRAQRISTTTTTMMVNHTAPKITAFLFFIAVGRIFLLVIEV
ncbi:hypothetical protein C7S14_4683 [Burkholderia cepacia]|nr:hypothetical protein C7S14_4683 [Burkholderia cepacia]